MEAYQRSQQRLLILVKTGQVSVLQNIGRVALHAAVVNGQSDFMQHRCPLQQRRQLRVRQLGILIAPLQIELIGGIQHATRLIVVDGVMVRQALRRTAADILMAEAALHLVEDAFAQRAVREAQLANRQRVEHAADNRQPRHEHRFTLFREARQAQRAERFMLHNLVIEHVQPLWRDHFFFFAHRLQHFARRLDGA